MNEFYTCFKESGPVAMYDIVLVEHSAEDGMTPGEAMTLAGKVSGPFEPIKFEGNNSIAMGFISIEASELFVCDADTDPVNSYWDELEAYIVSILNDINLERPSCRYHFCRGEKKISIFLSRDIKATSSSMLSVFELSTMHIKPETFYGLLSSDDYTVIPKFIHGDIYGCFVAVPYNIDIPYRTPTDLVSCIQAAMEVDADWLMFDGEGRVDPTLPCYDEWADWGYKIRLNGRFTSIPCPE